MNCAAFIMDRLSPSSPQRKPCGCNRATASPAPANWRSEAWEAARARVDKYLFLLGMRTAALRWRLVLQVMDRATHRASLQSRQSLAELAKEEVERALINLRLGPCAVVLAVREKTLVGLLTRDNVSDLILVSSALRRQRAHRTTACQRARCFGTFKRNQP